MITTVTRKIFRTTYRGAWVDSERQRGLHFDSRTVVQVGVMHIGPPLDHDTFLSHVRLGNDGVSMRDGVIDHYFEHEDILLEVMDLWSKDCTFHTVQDVQVVWDKAENEGDVPL